MVSGDITQLLESWSQGDPQAFEQVLALVYDRLRRQARSYMRRERADHTLQSTALVHEIILRLMEENRAEWKSRDQFFAVAARLMRRVLVDHARASISEKRGGKAAIVPLLPELKIPAPAQQDFLALDEALDKFTAVDPAAARLVEMRYFWGMTIEETAEALGVSRDSVKRTWTAARMWLHRECEGRLHAGLDDVV